MPRIGTHASDLETTNSTLASYKSDYESKKRANEALPTSGDDQDGSGPSKKPKYG